MTDIITTNPWLVIAVSALVTYASRFLGTALSGRISRDDAIFTWLSYVTYALLMALIARMLIFPIGSLAETSDSHRFMSVAVALAVFFTFKRQLIPALASGVTAFSLWGVYLL